MGLWVVWSCNSIESLLQSLVKQSVLAALKVGVGNATVGADGVLDGFHKPAEAVTCRS